MELFIGVIPGCPVKSYLVDVEQKYSRIFRSVLHPSHLLRLGAKTRNPSSLKPSKKQAYQTQQNNHGDGQCLHFALNPSRLIPVKHEQHNRSTMSQNQSFLNKPETALRRAEEVSFSNPWMHKTCTRVFDMLLF